MKRRIVPSGIGRYRQGARALHRLGLRKDSLAGIGNSGGDSDCFRGKKPGPAMEAGAPGECVPACAGPVRPAPCQ
jgi:hypothetical protein